VGSTLLKERKHKDDVAKECLSVELKLNEPDLSEETNLLSELEKLEEACQALLEEKVQLENTERTLKKQVIEEIKNRRQKTDTLKKEISKLKERCETWAKMLDIQIQK
jgi:hypothetical protein